LLVSVALTFFDSTITPFFSPVCPFSALFAFGVSLSLHCWFDLHCRTFWSSTWFPDNLGLKLRGYISLISKGI
jgi:hypothetical protein